MVFQYINKYKIILLVVLLHTFLLLRTQFTLWPEIVSFPYLLQNGFVIYKDFIHVYPPLLTFILYLFFNIVGYKIVAIKVAVWAFILIGDFILYLIAKKLLSYDKYILFPLILYVFLQTFLEGNMLWFDTALTVPVLIFTYCVLNSRWNGAIVSVIALCLLKQNAVFIFAGFFFYLVFRQQWKILKKLVLISFVSLFILLVYLGLQNSFRQAFEWVVWYPSRFWTSFPGYIQMSLTKHQILTVILISIPALFLFIKRKGGIVSFLFILSLMGVYPRFSFFHFQPALAVGAVCFLLLIKYCKVNYLLVLIVATLSTIYIIKPFLVTATASDTRFFSESEISLSEKLKKTIPSNSRVYLLNIPSQMYVLTNTLPPKPWVDNYGWYFEMPGEQDQMLRVWKENPPTYIVWKEKMAGNWYDPGVYEPQMVVSYIQTYYEQRWKIENDIWIWKKKN